MGYFIKPLPHKKKNPKWKLQWIDYSKGGAPSSGTPDKGASPTVGNTSKTGGASKGRKTEPRKTRDIPREDWLVHGFNPQWDLDQARVRKDEANAQAELKRQAERKIAIRKRVEKDKLVATAYLNAQDVAEFEQKILFERMSRGELSLKTQNKIQSHWKTAAKMITELKLTPEDWFEESIRFYNLFAKHKFSPNYVQKLLRIINAWGAFKCRKQKKFFQPIPSPRGYEQQRITDHFYDKTPTGRGMESEPLTPEMLEASRSKLLEANYQWLYISVWVGLRPKEIDSLKEKSLNSWKVETDKHGTKILSVHQSKLTGVSREKRWKYIPLVYKEQLKALEYVLSGTFRRPLQKTMHKHFNENIKLYGGRKGFTDLMLGRGQRLEDISQWLGHTTIERTWKSYKNKTMVHYQKVS